MITTGDVCELSGLPHQTVITWIHTGLIEPTVRGGNGRGRAHRFDLVAALGVTVAGQVHQSEHGCCPGYVAQVVRAFAATPEADLLAAFAAGHTHLAAVHAGRPLLAGPQAYWRPNVKDIYLEIQRRMT